MHEHFEAYTEDHYNAGTNPYTLTVVPVIHEGETKMLICCNEENVYITKEQAMAFFNLKEA